MSRPLDPPPSKVQLFDGQWIRWLFNLYQHSLGFVTVGYGGGKQLSNVSFDIPTVTFNTLPFDTLAPVTQIGVTFDTASDTFTFESAGAWTIMFNMSLQNHNSNNGGRNFTIRAFNVTQTVAGDGVVVGVGRNVTDTFISISFLAEVSQANVDNNDSFRIEVGNADTAITGGILVAGGIQVTHSSELGLLG